MSQDRIVRIGCASGFWGDSALAAPQLVRRARIDYLVFDYLAEVTMSIMARAKARDPAGGYAGDFVSAVMAEIVKDVADKSIRVIANAGGVNPEACRDALARLAAEAGAPLKIAVVLGDDVMKLVPDLKARGVREMFTGEPLPDRLLSANAYFGAFPIAAALDAGADVVITGRCVDSALALGPLIHEFGWRPEDHDRLAAGSLAGHIIECGAQATGGLFTDWREVPGWDDIGYPIVECAADGGFVLTKPEGTGGLVTPATAAEQMVYEIGDPAAYVLPDVTCDFTEVRMRQDGPHRVRIEGARGRPPSPDYKVSATHLDGYRLTFTLTIGGAEAAAKARATGEALIARTRAAFRARGWPDYRAVLVEVLGAEDGYGPHARAVTREAVMRFAAHHDDKAALELLAREAMAPVTSMAPGTTGYIGGRPAAQSVVRLTSFLAPKSVLGPRVLIDGREIAVDVAPGEALKPAPPRKGPPAHVPAPADGIGVPLIRLAHGRSGDKGDSVNIGIIARREDYVPLLRSALGEAVVAAYFRHLVKGPVTRYEVPGINGFNFVLERALGGGGAASLRNDPQGKTFAQMLLGLEIAVPIEVAKGLADG